jgi:predicted NBD/HSP70 family sugar kinase
MHFVNCPGKVAAGRACHDRQPTDEGMAATASLPTRATHQRTRAFNQQLVLRAIYDHSPISRAELARLTGLTRTSVSELVGEVIADGLVEEVGRGPSSGGKAPILVQFAPAGRHIIGLDLGEATFSAALVDMRGAMVRTLHRPLEGRDGDDAVQLAYELVEDLRAGAERPLLGIGIGAPGLIDSDSGVVRWAVNLDWADLPLGRRLAERFGVPVAVANDSQAAALAEVTFFRRPRPQNLVVIRIGRGVGAGIVLNGHLFQGDGYGAGEIGHTSVVAEGERCRCGSRGCLETVASMRAMVEAAGRTDAAVRDEAGLLAAFAAGDGAVRAIALAAAAHLGRAIAALVGVLNVHHVLLVGPVAGLGDEWLAEVRRHVAAGALRLLAAETVVEFGHPHEDMVLLGASAMLMNRELGLGLAR